MKRNVKKTICLLLSVLLLSASIALSPQKVNAAVTVSRVVQNASGKSYLEVDGKPFLYLQVQNCGTQMCKRDKDGPIVPQLPLSHVENAFEKTAALNYKVISIILKWNDFEPSTQGVFDWTVIDQYVDWANQYGLRIDFAWFGSNSCGGTRLPGYAEPEFVNVPVYLQDHDKYFGHGDFYGVNHCPWNSGPDDDYMRSCEINAITNLFNHLAQYDTNHRVIFFQVLNEPNLHPYWSSERDSIISHMHNISNAVKNSNYAVATRVNTSGQYPYPLDTSIIDVQGDDLYKSSVQTVRNYMNAFDPGKTKFPYIPENTPYDNTSSLIVATLSNGGFYGTWELFSQWWDGIYDSDFKSAQLGVPSAYSHAAADMKNLNAGLNKIGSLIAETPKSKMAEFNTEADIPAASCNITKALNFKNLGFQCSDASVGMVVNKGDYYYCISDTANNGNVHFITNESPIAAEYGYIDDNGNWSSQGNSQVVNNGDGTWSMSYNSQQCIRLQLSPAQDSTLNLALNKTATMLNGTAGWGHIAAHAVDGNTGTYAQSNADVPWDLQVDLGANVQIGAVSAMFGSINYPTAFSIKVSPDGNSWTDVASESAGAGGTKTYYFNEVAGRYVKMDVTATNAGPGWGYAVYEFGVYGSRLYAPTPEQGINIALNKTATASSELDASHNAAKAVDGIVASADNTKWCSTLGETSWLKVDLGQNYNITRYVVKHSEYFEHFGTQICNTRDFKFQVSNDGTNWTDVDTVIGNMASITDHNVATSGRYVRLYITNPQTETSYRAARIYEFEVYTPGNNLALSKTVTASSEYALPQSAAKAVDGIALSADNTKWSSTLGETSWLKVDLGQNYNITRYIVKHCEVFEHFGTQSCNTRDFKFQVSSDGANWTDVDTVSGNTANITDHNVTASGRYVRLYITTPQTETSYRAGRIYEFEVYGD